MTADERIGEPEGGSFRGPLARGHDGDLLADEVSGDRGRIVKAFCQWHWPLRTVSGSLRAPKKAAHVYSDLPAISRDPLVRVPQPPVYEQHRCISYKPGCMELNR